MSKHLSSLFQKVSLLLKRIADLFFPYTCFGCGISHTWLCKQCEERIPLLPLQRCFLCQKNSTRYGEACFRCQGNHPLDAVFAASCYQVPLIKKMIHTYKYQFVRSLHEPLGKILSQSIEKSNIPLATVLIPVPLHSKRLRYRGFNQSTLLCNEIANNVTALAMTPTQEILHRKRSTLPQQKTSSRVEREENLAHVFSVLPNHDLAQHIVWLVDDVATTHSTLTECARTLKEAGAKKVYGVVLAQD